METNEGELSRPRHFNEAEMFTYYSLGMLIG